MSQDVRQIELREKTQQLLQGSLKHVKAAGLAAALVPLAAVAVSSAESRMCSSAGIVCGYVWFDTNHNGIQDAGESPIEGAVVTLGSASTATNLFGVYEFPVPAGTYEIAVQIPPGTQPTLSNMGSDDSADSDGVPDGLGNSLAPVTLVSSAVFNASTDFGFWVPPVAQPGTGTPGYWKTHPEAWPVDSITVGGVVYTREQAIAWLETPGKDRTITMFSSLVPAKLNVVIGNDDSCVASTIAAADAWMETSGPVGSGVHAASLAWKLGEPLHRLMDNYNNGMLCAPHRD
ncbi:MAG: SdrD B-like domain-containing protein [Vicinamibacterales bacterium]